MLVALFLHAALLLSNYFQQRLGASECRRLEYPSNGRNRARGTSIGVRTICPIWCDETYVKCQTGYNDQHSADYYGCATRPSRELKFHDSRVNRANKPD